MSKVRTLRVSDDKHNNRRAWYSNGRDVFYGTNLLWGNTVLFRFKLKNKKINSLSRNELADWQAENYDASKMCDLFIEW